LAARELCGVLPSNISYATVTTSIPKTKLEVSISINFNYIFRKRTRTELELKTNGIDLKCPKVIQNYLVIPINIHSTMSRQPV